VANCGWDISMKSRGWDISMESRMVKITVLLFTLHTYSVYCHTTPLATGLHLFFSFLFSLTDAN